VNPLTFSEVLSAFALRALILRAEEAPPVPADDPTRNPDYCWTHGQIYPACAGQHEEK
jgi:hypothetical protein